MNKPVVTLEGKRQQVRAALLHAQAKRLMTEAARSALAGEQDAVAKAERALEYLKAAERERKALEDPPVDLDPLAREALVLKEARYAWFGDERSVPRLPGEDGGNAA